MKPVRIILTIIAAAAFAAAGGGVWFVRSLGPVPVLADTDLSTQVLDRNGRLLRAYATPDGRWRLPVTVFDVDPRFIEMLQIYEDRRFRNHAGVDPLAMSRAAWQFLASARVISGGSTLTMQVARLLEPRAERTLGAKLRQIVRALEIERNMSKDEVLGLYLTLAPYGGNLEGIRAASLAYFGKEPKKLSLAEAALLVALPQSPELRRPDRSATVARAARDRVLDRIAKAGRVPADEVAFAKLEVVVAGRRPMPALAPHASDQTVAALPKQKLHRLTIDAALQKNLEDLARERAKALGPNISVAIIAVDNASGEVLARVASADYFDERRAGQVDMTDALRSPGSALKPFIYGLAFEDGIAHPETLIEDRPVRYGAYAPENFDMTFQGTVTTRRALQMSLNVPAVSLLDGVGASRLNARIAQAGGTLMLPKGEAPGLAMALGGLGIKLSDLTMLYVGLARGGNAVSLVERITSAEPAAPRRLLDPVASWYLGNILVGTPPPENAAGGRIAFKTGTSYGYRDAWSVGFDGKRTIGVWVGRPDGAPVAGLVGRVAAAPILFDVFARLGQPAAPLQHAPRGAVFSTSAKLPPPLRHFRPNGVVASDSASPPLRIMFPPNNARLELTTFEGKTDPLALKITGGVEPLTVLVNGAPTAARVDRRTLFVDPDGPGFLRLTVIDARGAADSVMVRLQ
ncbi:MAG: penicillin-binding protein 1C [Alphaproteobacteria bacterium]|nr:penicillin-binding protein 1C [Alphaproteobacteria bacterium]